MDSEKRIHKGMDSFVVNFQLSFVNSSRKDNWQ